MKTEDIKLFHAIVDCGSLVRASDIYNLPKSNLSRRIKSLEQELGFNLFHRHQRSMKITDSGQAFYEKTKDILDELDATIEDITNPGFDIKGHIRVQLLPLPDVSAVLSFMFKFMELHPKVHIEIITSSEEQNMIENQIDLAFRIGQQMADSQLVARPIRTVRTGFFASPKFIETNGMPKTLDELSNMDFILFRGPDGQVVNRLNIAEDKSMPINGKLIFNHLPMSLEACLQHQGVIYFPIHVGNRHVTSGKLIRLLADVEPMLNVGWLVYPKRTSLSLAASRLIDFLLEELTHLDLNQLDKPFY